MSLVKNPNQIRLAMLGMVDGNGHPYSWSAILNGTVNREEMAKCPYPVIPAYLFAQPPAALGIPGARVTHIWCDDKEDARRVAKASGIETVVERPEDVLGHVDAVIIPTDKPEEHVRRARPFIEAGLPVFVDKPLVDSEEDLRQFVTWQRQGKLFMSSSCMRYSTEFAELRKGLEDLGPLRLITMTMCKSWERYGIHALEGVYPFLPPGGWRSVVNSGTSDANVLHIEHEIGAHIVLAVIADMYGAFGVMGVHGTKGSLCAKFSDTFTAFKSQLAAFVQWLRDGRSPVPMEQTVELMKIIIAGIRSRNLGGARILLSDIHETEQSL